MGSEVQPNPYRDAYMAANAELDQIMELCARLRARKETLEVAVEALRPLVEASETVIPIIPSIYAVQAAATREGSAPGPVPVKPQVEMRSTAAHATATRSVSAPSTIEETGDVLEKRIASALEKVTIA